MWINISLSIFAILSNLSRSYITKLSNIYMLVYIFVKLCMKYFEILIRQFDHKILASVKSVRVLVLGQIIWEFSSISSCFSNQHLKRDVERVLSYVESYMWKKHWQLWGVKKNVKYLYKKHLVAPWDKLSSIGFRQWQVTNCFNCCWTSLDFFFLCLAWFLTLAIVYIKKDNWILKKWSKWTVPISPWWLRKEVSSVSIGSHALSLVSVKEGK